MTENIVYLIKIGVMIICASLFVYFFNRLLSPDATFVNFIFALAGYLGMLFVLFTEYIKKG